MWWLLFGDVISVIVEFRGVIFGGGIMTFGVVPFEQYIVVGAVERIFVGESIGADALCRLICGASFGNIFLLLKVSLWLPMY
jgi:hypothetical protein